MATLAMCRGRKRILRVMSQEVGAQRVVISVLAVVIVPFLAEDELSNPTSGDAPCRGDGVRLRKFLAPMTYTVVVTLGKGERGRLYVGYRTIGYRTRGTQNW
jgi:hypothetical protein